MKKALTAVGLAGMLLVGSVAPAQAAYGDLTNCKTTVRYTSDSKIYSKWCTKQMSSLPVLFKRVHIYTHYYPLKGTNY